MRLFEIDSSDQLYNQYKQVIAYAAEAYHNRGVGIYRGFGQYEYLSATISLIDPSKRSTPRKSAHTHNYYTLWIDNSALWQKYPKRSYSLICTTDLSTAEGYGELGVVIPIANNTIGICPDADFWISFKRTLKDLNLSELMDWLHFNFEKQNITIPETYNQLLQSLDQLDLSNLYSTDYSNLADLFQSRGARGAMDWILDPQLNGFTVTTYNNFQFPRYKEVWLSGPCLVIPIDDFDSIAKGAHPKFT